MGKEPTIKEATYSGSGPEHSYKPALRADLVNRGLFGEAHKDAFIDFRVHDADASSALSNIRASLNRQEAQKLLKYKEACDRRGATFLPFVISAGEGILSPKASLLLNQLANGLATKWNKTKAGVRSWIHTRLTFAVIRGSSMCILDRQYSWKKIGLYQYDWDDARGPFRSLL